MSGDLSLSCGHPLFEPVNIRCQSVDALRLLIDLGLMSGDLSLSCGHPPFEPVNIRCQSVDALRVLIYLCLMSGYLPFGCSHPVLEPAYVVCVRRDLTVRRYDVRSVVSDIGVGRIYPSVRVA